MKIDAKSVEGRQSIKIPGNLVVKLFILQKFDYRYKKYHGQIWISKKPSFWNICWVSILFLVNTWVHVNGSMVPNQPSKHRTHLQDQMTRRWLPKLSTGAATGRLPYQKEMALLRWAFIYFSIGEGCQLNWHGFLLKNIFLAKKGKIFCGVLFFWGGLKCLMLHFWDFLADMILILSARGLFWCASIPIGHIVGTKTHFAWTHLVLGPPKPRIYCWRNCANPNQATKHTNTNNPVTCGGVWDFSTFLYIFHLLHKDGAPQPSCNLLFFLTLVMGWDYFSPP